VGLLVKPPHTGRFRSIAKEAIQPSFSAQKTTHAKQAVGLLVMPPHTCRFRSKAKEVIQSKLAYIATEIKYYYF
jgi:hypothetical protein